MRSVIVHLETVGQLGDFYTDTYRRHHLLCATLLEQPAILAARAICPPQQEDNAGPERAILRVDLFDDPGALPPLITALQTWLHMQDPARLTLEIDGETLPLAARAPRDSATAEPDTIEAPVEAFLARHAAHTVPTPTPEVYRRARRAPADRKSLDDLAWQLAETKLHLAAGDYDAAATALSDIDFDQTSLWNFRSLIARLHEPLQGHIQDRRLASWSANALGSAYARLARHTEAIACHEKALALAREINHRKSQGGILSDLALAHTRLGRHEEAFSCYEQALALARKMKNRDLEINCLINLGDTCRALQRKAEALQHYEQALSLAREQSDRSEERLCQYKCAETLRSLGRLPEAEALLCSPRLAAARAAGDRETENTLRASLAQDLYHKGFRILAAHIYEQVIASMRETGVPEQALHVKLESLISIYYALGRHEEALARSEEDLAVLRKVTDPTWKSAQLIGTLNLGNGYRLVGRLPEAQAHSEQALQLARELGEDGAEARCLEFLGKVAYDGNRPEEASAYFEHSMALERQTGTKWNYAMGLSQLAKARWAAGELEAALTTAQEGLRIAQQLNCYMHIGLTATVVALVQASAGDFNAALAAAEMAISCSLCSYSAPEAHGVHGIIAWRLGRVETAHEAFQAARAAAEAALRSTTRQDQFDFLGIAHCGLALVEPAEREAHLQAARAAFRAARALNRTPGIVAEVQRSLALLDAGLEALAAGEDA